MLKTIYMLVAVLLGVRSLSAAPEPGASYRVEPLSVNEGLSQIDSWCVIQDRYGFMWICTHEGLDRYDGHDFRVFKNDPHDETSISGNRVLSACCDSAGNLWIGTASDGLNRFDYAAERFVRYRSGFSGNTSVVCIHEYPRGTLWIGTSDGLLQARVRGDTLCFSGCYLAGERPSAVVSSVAQDGHGNILAGTNQGLRVLIDRQDGTYCASDTTYYNRVRINKIVVDSSGGIWICTRGGLRYAAPQQVAAGRWEAASHRAIPELEGVDVVSLLRQGDVSYVVTRRGVGRIDGSGFGWLPLSDNAFFRRNTIKNAWIDRSNNLWVSSAHKGVARIDLYPGSAFISSLDKAPGISPRAIIRDRAGNLWLDGKASGLCLLDGGGNFSRITSIRGKPVTGVPSMVEDGGGNVWFAVEHDVIGMPPGGRRYVRLSELKGYPRSRAAANVFSLCSDGGEKLFAGYSNGVLAVDGPLTPRPRFRFIPMDSIIRPGLQSNKVNRLYYDSRRRMLWVCVVDEGLAVLRLGDDGTVERRWNFSKKGGFPTNHVWDVRRLRDSTLLLGSDVGVFRAEVERDEITFTPFSSHPRLNNTKIITIVEDASRNLWMATSQGLLRYDRRNNSVKTYTHDDGLASSSINAGLCCDDGILYVGTIGGVNLLNLDLLSDNPYPAEVIFTDFRIFNRSIRPGQEYNGRVVLSAPPFMVDEIELRHDENNFSLEFVAAHYSSADKNEYAYMLAGYDRDWIHTDHKKRYVSYNSLPAGRYTFMVRASNNDNVWSGGTASIDIVVRPAPWVSWWAVVLYVLSGLGLACVIFHYFDKQARLKRRLMIEQLERENETKLNALKLRFHTDIAHDIRTPLTLIKAPVEEIARHAAGGDDGFVREKIALVEKNVGRLTYLVNQFLDLRHVVNNASGSKAAPCRMNAFFRDIANAFEGLAESRNIRFECVIDLLDEVLSIDRDKVSKILYNLLSNAFKYTPPGGEVFLFAEQSDSELIVQVVDTGIGIPADRQKVIFERFYHAGGNGTDSSGIGLSLVKHLAEIIGGRIELRSEEGHGSRFTLTVPCKKAEEEALPERPCEQPDIDDRKAVVLLVEDDTQMRNYLTGCLKDYTVIGAANGRDGFDKALRYTPNLILTDIMMPEMDGLEMMRLLRGDIRTSHIPIIVLSARGENTDELAGLEAGADDYIYKPFSAVSLLLKVRNITAFHRSAAGCDRSGRSLPTVNEREKSFLDRMNGIIIEKMNDPLFCIDYICENVGISRMQLHRKMVSLLGKTTSEYIREIRLDTAKRLLETGSYQIADVMVKVGINSATHFNRNFKERFGMLPSEVRRKKGNK